MRHIHVYVAYLTSAICGGTTCGGRTCVQACRVRYAGMHRVICASSHVQGDTMRCGGRHKTGALYAVAMRVCRV